MGRSRRCKSWRRLKEEEGRTIVSLVSSNGCTNFERLTVDGDHSVSENPRSKHGTGKRQGRREEKRKVSDKSSSKTASSPALEEDSPDPEDPIRTVACESKDEEPNRQKYGSDEHRRQPGFRGNRDSLRLAILGHFVVVLGLPREDGSEGEHHSDAAREWGRKTNESARESRHEGKKKGEKTNRMGMNESPTEPRENPCASITRGTAKKRR